MSDAIGKPLLLATKNRGKLREISDLFKDLPLEIVPLTSFHNLPPCAETGNTFAENARQKAEHYHRLTRLMTVAEDSGLAVDALNGFPGVGSARFAGEQATDQDRINKLLTLLEGVPGERRTARFFCAVSLFDNGTELFTAENSCPGRILHEPRGSGGFGFDPVFFVPELGKTFAELTPQEKNKHSHRAQAFNQTKEWLQRYLSKSRAT